MATPVPENLGQMTGSTQFCFGNTYTVLKTANGQKMSNYF